MPTMHQLVTDGSTGSALGGANAKGRASTQCCSNSGWPNSCTHSGDCNSGQGYDLNVNADATSGILVWDEQYSCAQSFSLTVSAPGYNDTAVSFTRGEGSSDDYNTTSAKAIQLTPIQNVSQQNQGVSGGVQGTTSTTGIDATSALGSGLQSLTAAASSPASIIMMAVIGVVAVVIIVLLIAIH